jgi:hypothetical protein
MWPGVVPSTTFGRPCAPASSATSRRLVTPSRPLTPQQQEAESCYGRRQRPARVARRSCNKNNPLLRLLRPLRRVGACWMSTGCRVIGQIKWKPWYLRLLFVPPRCSATAGVPAHSKPAYKRLCGHRRVPRLAAASGDADELKGYGTVRCDGRDGGPAARRDCEGHDSTSVTPALCELPDGLARCGSHHWTRGGFHGQRQPYP